MEYKHNKYNNFVFKNLTLYIYIIKYIFEKYNFQILSINI